MSGIDLSLYNLVVIGASAGGLDILTEILPALKKSGRLSVAFVLHLPTEGPNLIPSLLAPLCALKVSEAEAGEPMEVDHIYVAPTNYHLCIEPDLTLSLSSDEYISYSRPSIDVLLESAAYSCSKKTVGILLSGANHDGARGLAQIKEQGGLTIVQNPSDAEFPQMPQSALNLFTPDLMMTTSQLKSFLTKLSAGGKYD